MKKEITSRQLSALLLLSIFSLKLLSLPSFVYRYNGADAIYSLFLNFTLDFISLGVALYFLNYKKNINTYDYLAQKISKIVTKIIYVLIFIVYYMKFEMILIYSFSYFRGTIFLNASLTLFLLIFISSVSGILLFEIKAFARTTEFFIPFICFGLVTCLVTFFLSDKMAFGLNPIMGSVSEIIGAGFQTSLWFGDYFFIFLFLDKVKPDKKMNKRILMYTGFGLSFMFVFYVIFFKLYGRTVPGHYNAITDLVTATKKASGVGSMDWIPIFTVMLIFILQSGTFAFAMRECYSKVIGDNNLKRFTVMINVLALLSVYLAFNNAQITTSFAVDYMKYVAVLIFYLLPLLLLGLAVFEKLTGKKKKVKYEKNYG